MNSLVPFGSFGGMVRIMRQTILTIFSDKYLFLINSSKSELACSFTYFQNSFLEFVLKPVLCINLRVFRHVFSELSHINIDKISLPRKKKYILIDKYLLDLQKGSP